MLMIISVFKVEKNVDVFCILKHKNCFNVNLLQRKWDKAYLRKEHMNDHVKKIRKKMWTKSSASSQSSLNIFKYILMIISDFNEEKMRMCFVFQNMKFVLISIFYTENEINIFLLISDNNIWKTKAKIYGRKYEQNRLLVAV